MDRIFLLGGYDLEMITIKDLLAEHKEDFFDYRLSWGARLSSYSDVLNPYDLFIGIELFEDINPPMNYYPVDHHNQGQNKPSSIEQIADLLKLKLNRYQLLVAANDKGYIPAMEVLGASRPEIDEIRKADRSAQGVMEEDELLAVKSINEGLEQHGDFIIVNSLTSKFSTITDRLYPFWKLLIYFYDHFVFYGAGKDKLVSHFSELIKEGKAYHGGGKDGFFGLAKGSFTPSEVIKLKNEAINYIHKL